MRIGICIHDSLERTVCIDIGNGAKQISQKKLLKGYSKRNYYTNNYELRITTLYVYNYMYYLLRKTEPIVLTRSDKKSICRGNLKDCTINVHNSKDIDKLQYK